MAQDLQLPLKVDRDKVKNRKTDCESNSKDCYFCTIHQNAKPLMGLAKPQSIVKK